MANLLERSSLVLTPTAYNNGEALCIKPDDASGDFQFSRNSAATRVNAQGLVENVQILSSNLVQNGDFSEEGAEEVSNGSFSQEGVQLVTNGDFENGSTGWTKQTEWSISNGKAIANSSNGSIYQSINFIDNKSYKITFDITEYTSGEVACRFNNDVTNTYNSVGTHTLYFVSNNSFDYVYFLGLNSFTGSIDNVSVREVGQDWILGAGWSIGEDKALNTGGANFSDLTQLNTDIIIGKNYKITYTVSDYVSGSFKFIMNSNTTAGLERNADGTYTDYLTSAAQAYSFRTQGSGFIGSITNISVKEVGMDWILGTGWSIGDGVAETDSTSSYLGQEGVISTTNPHILTFQARLKSGTNGTVTALIGGSNSKQFTILDTNWQTFTYENTRLPSSQNGVYFNNDGNEIEITNISAIEITDDTNLPRINYENFSYQDALGSELVVNGGFATDSDWTVGASWTIGNGFATSNGGQSFLTQNVGFVVGLTYLVTFNINRNSGNLFVRDSSGVTKLIINENNDTTLQSFYFTSTSSGIINFYSYDYNGSIDNVSVKEYLGQEVVPNSGCGSWLWEPQSTNLVTQSEALSTMQNQSTITDNILTSPTGNVNASLVVENTATNSHGITKTTIIPTNPSATSYTISIFAKKKERQYIQFWLYADSTSFTSSGFDLENGTTSGDANTHKIKDFGNGWYRCSFTKDVTQSTGGFNFARVSMGTSPTSFYYTGDGASGLYMFGYQLEQNSFITSYIPTSGSTVTRNQDVCTNGGSLATINSAEGVLYAEIAALADGGTFRAISLNDGTTNNNNVIRIYCASADNRITIIIRSNGNLVLNYNHTLTSIIDFNKIAIKYKQNDFSLWVNGVNIHTETTGNTPIGLNELVFNNGLGTELFYGKTKALAVWKEALSDQELTDLTTI